MGVATRGLVLKKITQYDIYNFIYHTFDKESHLYFDKSETYYSSGTGSISFNDGTEQRVLFFILDSHANDYDFISSEAYTYLRLGCTGNSVKIMQQLVAYFGGGWIDENDCDDEDFYKIPASDKVAIPEVIRMTQDALNKAMGGVVIITE